jgi:hypothetical protein
VNRPAFGRGLARVAAPAVAAAALVLTPFSGEEPQGLRVRPVTLTPELGPANGGRGVLRSAPPAPSAAEEQLDDREALLSTCWAELLDPNAAPEGKLLRIDELLHYRDERLNAFLLQQLRDPSVRDALPGSVGRSGLIFAAERARVNDQEQRRAIGEALLVIARRLRGGELAGGGDEAFSSTDNQALASSVRRATSLLSLECADALLDFLRPTDRRLTQQVALQAVQAIFTVMPTSVTPPAALMRRVAEISRACLAQDFLTSPDAIALSANAFAAAILLRVPEAADLLEQLIERRRRSLTRQACRVLLSALTHNARIASAAGERGEPEHIIAALSGLARI